MDWKDKVERVISELKDKKLRELTRTIEETTITVKKGSFHSVVPKKIKKHYKVLKLNEDLVQNCDSPNWVGLVTFVIDIKSKVKSGDVILRTKSLGIDHIFISPISGRITDVSVKVGDRADYNKEICTIRYRGEIHGQKNRS